MERMARLPRHSPSHTAIVCTILCAVIGLCTFASHQNSVAFWLGKATTQPFHYARRNIVRSATRGPRALQTKLLGGGVGDLRFADATLSPRRSLPGDLTAPKERVLPASSATILRTSSMLGVSIAAVLAVYHLVRRLFQRSHPLPPWAPTLAMASIHGTFVPVDPCINVNRGTAPSATSTEVPDPPLKMVRVLFMHGLESGPQGSKAQYFRSRYYAVEVPSMRMSKYGIHKRNSLIRGYIRAMRSFRLWPSQWMGGALTNSLSNCLDLQKTAIEEFKPDVVIGSSWGGGVGLLAFATEVWQGPMVLLAPALKTAITKTGRPTREQFQWDSVCTAIASTTAKRNILVVHGDADEVVPLEDSLEFGRRTGVEVMTIPGGDHRLNSSLLDTDEIVRLIDLVMQRSS